MDIADRGDLRVVAAPLAVGVVYGPRFTGAVPALRLLLPGVVALAGARPLRAMLLKEGRAVALSILGFGGLSLNVALNVALLPRIGIRGSSIASSLCYGRSRSRTWSSPGGKPGMRSGTLARSGSPSWSAP